MSQTWENGIKNLVPGQFWHLWPIFGPQKTLYGFFGGFYLYWMLYIVASYYCMQFQGKQMCQTWENGKKNLVPGRFWHLWPKFGPQKFLYGFFWWVLPLLDVIHCCKLSLYAMSRKTNEPNLRKWQKTLFWARFRPICPKFGPPIFFLKKTWLLSHYISLPAIIIYNIRKN